MAKFSEENGGLFRYEDFASYSAKLEEPVSTDYRGYTVYKNPSASQGPAELFALNILEGYDLKKMGLNSADYIHTTVEAVKLAMADRDKYLGDMDFIQIPYRGLLSKEYAAARRAQIDPAKASLEFRPGDVTPYAGTDYKPASYPTDVDLHGGASHEGDTSYISVVDRDRNLISFTPSLHSAFGSKVAIGNLGLHLQLPRRLLFAGRRPRQRARAGQTSAQHAAGDAGDEGRQAVLRDRQSRRGRSGDADDSDAARHDRFRIEHAAGDRGADDGRRAVSRRRRSRTRCIRAICCSKAAFRRR